MTRGTRMWITGVFAYLSAMSLTVLLITLLTIKVNDIKWYVLTLNIVVIIALISLQIDANKLIKKSHEID